MRTESKHMGLGLLYCRFASRRGARMLAPFAPLVVAMLAGQVIPSTTPAPVKNAVPSTGSVATGGAGTGSGPAPLLKAGQRVNWWFTFKFNAATLPGCAGAAQRSCPFGGAVQTYPEGFSQQFAYASSSDPALQVGGGCAGDTTTDPIGATFDQVYNGPYFYVVWNDQFKGNPLADQDAPHGPSKGMLAWDSSGSGLVLQVSTPSWPGSGSVHSPRKTDGNTLGCVNDDDVLVSQQFFALKLSEPDVVDVLKALGNASVVTDASKPELVNNGGPQEIQALAGGLGKVSKSKNATKVALSSGVTLISKPSDLQVPPWQMVSSLLGSEPLRVASWWSHPEIPTTAATSAIGCWDPSLAAPGAVEIATTGTWAGKPIGLEGIAKADGNHAKIGVSTGTHPYVIFGDMNQQGKLAGPNCDSSQNGRGGLFFVVSDAGLFHSVSALLKGATAPQ